MMNDAKIVILRTLVKGDRVTVMWWDRIGSPRQVLDVPEDRRDPDNTGVPDLIAVLDQGHVDLSNAEATDFYTLNRLFE